MRGKGRGRRSIRGGRRSGRRGGRNRQSKPTPSIKLDKAPNQNLQNQNTRALCRTFCPAEEIEQRKIGNDISLFEKKHRHVVKRYRRAAAGLTQDWTAIRDPATLLNVTQHLVCEVLAMEDLSLELYGFLADRFRSVRQDLIVQDVDCPEVKFILQTQGEVLVLFSNLFAGAPGFDTKLCFQQISQCVGPLRSWFGLHREGADDLVLAISLVLPGSTQELALRLYHLWCSLGTRCFEGKFVRCAIQLVRAAKNQDLGLFSRWFASPNCHALMRCALSASLSELEPQWVAKLNRAFRPQEPMGYAKLRFQLGFSHREASELRDMFPNNTANEVIFSGKSLESQDLVKLPAWRCPDPRSVIRDIINRFNAS